MHSQPPPTRSPTHYEILNLSPSTLSSLDDSTASQLIKRAYRRALLNHHPDKKAPNNHHHQYHHSQPLSSPSSSTYTIDQISTAYATLSNPAQRQAYDRTLLLLQQQSRSNPAAGGQQDSAEFQTGIETVDLDDLDYEEYTTDTNSNNNGNNSQLNTAPSTTTRWYRSCRCGNPRGYHFTEADLEEAADLGELMVGCADCSLWLRVHFAVVAEHDDEGPGGGDRNGSERDAAGTVVSR